MSSVYKSIYSFNMAVMVAELIVTQSACSDLLSLPPPHTFTNIKQLGLNSSGQMSGVCFGVNVGLESPAGD